MPKRIQMSRQHPWRAENPNAVVVARPTKWGNPFVVREAGGRLVVRHKNGPLEVDITSFHISHRAEAFAEAVANYRAILEHPWSTAIYPDIRAALAGKDLACWCPLDQPCHADVLLAIANAPVEVAS